MKLSSIDRRYGYGAARLCLGQPTQTPGLAASRHDAVRGEMRFAFLPGLLCVLLSLVLFSTTALERTAPDDEFVDLDPSRIELAPTPEPIAAPEIREASANPMPSSNAATPTQTSPKSAPPSRAPMPSPAPVPVPQFARLDVPTDTAGSGALAVLSNRQSDLRPGADPAASLDANWTARLVSQTATRNAPVELGHASAISAARAGARPGDHASASDRPGSIEVAGAGSSRFMTPTRLPEQGPSGFGTNTRDAPPHVSAKRVQPEFARSIRESLASARAGRGTGDWREVPLAALPDCSPAGRQDRLKQAILRATPDSRICEHANGRFRFVPSRNLGSFLMWTEEWGTSTSSFAAAPDACVALEAALRCLSQPGTHP